MSVGPLGSTVPKGAPSTNSREEEVITEIISLLVSRGLQARLDYVDFIMKYIWTSVVAYRLARDDYSKLTQQYRSETKQPNDCTGNRQSSN